MIITITCNPAIDKTITSGNEVIFDVGGKGINVSKVLNNLNIKSLITGFVGKENKNVVTEDLDELELEHHFIEVDGRVRTNTKRIIDNVTYEDNEDGPIISNKNIDDLFDYLKQFRNEIIIISGSAPNSCESKLYKRIIELLKKNDNYILLDASKDLLKYGIEAKPDFIKPNKEEVCKLFGIEYDEELIIEKCKNLGIKNICISLGKDGALFIFDNHVYKCKGLDIDVKTTTGAGDAMVAGFAYSYLNNFDDEKTIKMMMALSASACETLGTKPPEFDDVLQKTNDVEILNKC